MIGKTLASLLIALFLLSNPAFATNWVYLQRLEGTREGPVTEYLDIDSVVKSEDKVVYWTVWVLDKEPSYDGARKIMFKKEAPLVYPLRHRNLEIYRYDGENMEIRRNFIPTNYAYYTESPDEINRALQYAGLAKDGEAAKPDPTVTPSPRWYGSVRLPDCDLYWNIRSIVAWPQDNPTTIEIIVKYVWNKDGLERRMAYLKTQKRYGAGFEGLGYTLVNYQFLLTENKARIISEADHDTGGQRRTLLDSGDWHDIAKGSKEEQARRIALKWLNDKESYGE